GDGDPRPGLLAEILGWQTDCALTHGFGRWADSQLEGCKPVAAVVGGQLGNGDLAFLVSGKRTTRSQPFQRVKCESANPTAEDKLGRWDALQLDLIQMAVAIDVEVVKKMLHEVLPDFRERLTVDANVQADQDRPGFAEQDEILHVAG